MSAHVVNNSTRRVMKVARNDDAMTHKRTLRALRNRQSNTLLSLESMRKIFIINIFIYKSLDFIIRICDAYFKKPRVT